MKRKLTRLNKRKLNHRRLAALRSKLPANLCMTPKLYLLVNFYVYMRASLAKDRSEQRYMGINFDESFTEQNFITAIYQDLFRWRSNNNEAPSEKLRLQLIASLSRLFPYVVAQAELDNVNLGVELCDTIRYHTEDYSLNRVSSPPYQPSFEYSDENENISPESLKQAFEILMGLNEGDSR